MKREERITKLVAIGHKQSILIGLSNQVINTIYDREQPKLQARSRQIQKQNEIRERVRLAEQRERQRREDRAKFLAERLARRTQRVIDAENDALRQAEWMRRCVKVPFPPIGINYHTPKLDFGLAELLAYAKLCHARYGDKAAAAALRVIQAPKWDAALTTQILGKRMAIVGCGERGSWWEVA